MQSWYFERTRGRYSGEESGLALLDKKVDGYDEKETEKEEEEEEGCRV